jgi:membrane protein
LGRPLTLARALGSALAGFWREGFTHAGNLAYLALLALMPFCVLVAATAGALGRAGDGARMVATLIEALPPAVADVLEPPALQVIGQPASGGFLTLGVLLLLWTVSSYAEAVRDIIRRAHGVPPTLSIWRYRALSLLIVLAGVILMLFALAAQLLLAGIETFVRALLPMGADLVHGLGVNRVLPGVTLLAGLGLVLSSLTPPRLRRARWVWPGAAVAALLWVGLTLTMPWALGQLRDFSIPYGSLAGVIITLIYFWLLGLALVFGIHINAALAKAGQSRLKGAHQPL